MKGWVKGLLGLGVVAITAAYLGMPILTVRALVEAAETGDEAALERLVDFPAFRESLKDELTARLMAEAQADSDLNHSALGSLGIMLGPMLVSGVVDALVNPQAVATMVRTADTPDPPEMPPPPSAEEDAGDIRQSYGYRDLNTFVLSLTDPDRPDETLKLLLKRQGLFGWKLAGVDLPEA